jgi:hypothetical protein
LGNADTNNTLYNGTTSTGTNVNGFTPFNAFITYFYRWNVAMDPGTAWRYYMKGNGQNSLLGNMSAYGAKLQLTQNSVVSSTYSLF